LEDHGDAVINVKSPVAGTVGQQYLGQEQRCGGRFGVEARASRAAFLLKKKSWG
jgi:hypothetical protein